MSNRPMFGKSMPMTRLESGRWAVIHEVLSEEDSKAIDEGLAESNAGLAHDGEETMRNLFTRVGLDYDKDRLRPMDPPALSPEVESWFDELEDAAREGRLKRTPDGKYFIAPSGPMDSPSNIIGSTISSRPVLGELSMASLAQALEAFKVVRVGTIHELAILAYSEYSRTTGNKNYRGEEMPKFDELPDKIKEAWGSAVAAVWMVAQNENL